jgi:hypothetical protein
MAEEMGQDAMVVRFRKALQHENEHLAKVRNWYESLTMASGTLLPERSRKRSN